MKKLVSFNNINLNPFKVIFTLILFLDPERLVNYTMYMSIVMFVLSFTEV